MGQQEAQAGRRREQKTEVKAWTLPCACFVAQGESLGLPKFQFFIFKKTDTIRDPTALL